MKRPGMPARKTRLRSRSPIKQGGTPIKKVNPEQRAKRKRRQANKHRLYMASPTRRIVDARANGRCEAVAMWNLATGRVEVLPVRADDLRLRCSETRDLQHHHLTYARYGGHELPADMLKCCKRCHDYLESQKPTRHLSHHGADQ